MEETESENLDSLYQNFKEFKPASKPNIVKYGMIFVFVFWGSFAGFWILLNNPTISSKAANTVAQTASTVGSVLGVQSPWDKAKAFKYLVLNQSAIENNLEMSNLNGTYQVAKSDNSGEEIFTISSEYNFDQETSYVSFTPLQNSSLQVISAKNAQYVRMNASDKWGSNNLLKNSDFSTSKAATKDTVSLLWNSAVFSKHATFMGVTDLDETPVLVFSVNLDSAAYEALTEEKQYFADANFTYYIDPETNRLVKFDTKVNNFFIDETQYDMEKTVEFVEINEKPDLFKIIPKNTNRTDENVNYSDMDDFIRFFDII